MSNTSYQIKSAKFEFGIELTSNVEFTGPEADPTDTHITLLVGANGTSKSRILASLVEKICDDHSSLTGDNLPRRNVGSGPNGLNCFEINAIAGLKPRRKVSKNSPQLLLIDNNLPSRILVLSNLVMDKFHYSSFSKTEDPFYHYLGVRQATNLTTTGSAERSVTEAVLLMASDSIRLHAFEGWINLVFGTGRELALEFHRLRTPEIEKLLSAPNRHEMIEERMRRRFGSARRTGPDTADIAVQVVELFEFLADKISEFTSSERSNRAQALLRISSLTLADRRRLTELIPNFSAASRAGYSAWPTLCIESAPWLSFGQLSSGEQNLLALGAKLAAHAREGCLVVIDEPEVSLNVAWQQHYLNLLKKSLEHARGSHVIIATHSPHLISSVSAGKGSIVLIEKEKSKLSFKTRDAVFEGWGAESILYQVLGIPSASSFLLNRDLARVLSHIQDSGRNKVLIKSFLNKVSRLNYAGIEPLELVISEIQTYLESID